jgi:hypothetical protein
VSFSDTSPGGRGGVLSLAGKCPKAPLLWKNSKNNKEISNIRKI